MSHVDEVIHLFFDIHHEHSPILSKEERLCLMMSYIRSYVTKITQDINNKDEEEAFLKALKSNDYQVLSEIFSKLYFTTGDRMYHKILRCISS
jgi:hypothetical protein